MNEDWLGGSDTAPAVLVTVAAVKGSVPREAGAKMLVRATDFDGTIGGGHLEQRALEIARAILQAGAAPHIERFPLGPSLGQCCGGVAWLAFEHAAADQLDLLRARRNLDTWRITSLDDMRATALFDDNGSLLAGALAMPAFERAGGARVLEQGGRRWLVDPVLAPRHHLMLFGAGHVGAAIVRALAELPCRVTWVDERDDMFPAEIPANVMVEATDTPEALVAQAAPGTTFLVMTHSHALDLRLSIAILSRADQAWPDQNWFGLIGSSTKRRQFEHRLRERGIAEARIGAMVCPIGLPGIAGKAPAVIAVAVAAQLLTVWETAQASSLLDASPESKDVHRIS